MRRDTGCPKIEQWLRREIQGAQNMQQRICRENTVGLKYGQALNTECTNQRANARQRNTLFTKLKAMAKQRDTGCNK